MASSANVCAAAAISVRGKPRVLVIHDRPQRGRDFAEHLAALAVRFEIPERPQPRTQSILEGFHRLPEIAGLPVAFDQFGFEIKEVKVACRPGHEELHDAFRLRRMMQLAAEHAGQFAGEAAVHATLVDGPTTDLNLMWRRDWGSAAVERATVAGAVPSLPDRESVEKLVNIRD